MTQRLLLLILAIGLVVLIAPSPAGAAGDGVISGQLSNGTAGGTVPPSLEISLKTYVNNTETGTPATTTSDADGKFQFTGLSTASAYGYEVVFTYLEVEYTGDRITFGLGETSKTADMTIYETTTSEGVVEIGITHMVLSLEANGLRVTEYTVVNNDGDRAFVGAGPANADGKKVTIELSVPAAASGVQYGGALMTCCVIPIPGGLADTMAVLPGSKMISLSYVIEVKSSTYKVVRPVRYPTQALYLLVQDSGNVRISSDQLGVGNPLNVEGASYATAYGASLTPGTVIEATISGLPLASKQDAYKWAGLGVVVVAAGAGFGYLAFARKRPARPHSIPAASAGVGQASQRLMDEIAQLDDDLEDGKVSPEVHRELRAQKKKQLIDLMRQSHGESAST